MDLKKYAPLWRPYDHNLRAMRRFWRRRAATGRRWPGSGPFWRHAASPPAGPGEGNARKKSGQTLKMGDTGCKITLYFFFSPGLFVQMQEFYILPNYHFTLLTK